MYEVELKVRADHDTVRRRLREADAESRGTVRQSDVYYDPPHREFGQTDEALRLRRERAEDSDRSVLTYKGPRVDEQSKTRREAETPVGEPDGAATILTALGFDPAATVEKERERYVLHGHDVVLDRVTGLGEFVEVETAVPDDADTTIETAREGAAEILRELGLDPAEQIRRSYLGMLLEDNQE